MKQLLPLLLISSFAAVASVAAIAVTQATPLTMAGGVDVDLPPAHDLGPLPPDQPIELGLVHWERDYDTALARAQTEGKPVFVLFQEVPGCGNCTRYGEELLSHPLIVESIETDFVPLAIFNNRGGADAEVLERYGEPAWNNPVVRIVDADGRDLVGRLASFGSPAQLTGGMVAALAGFAKAHPESDAAAPAYLQLVAEEYVGRESATAVATFETACFWSGEGHLGAQPGIIRTTAGWQDGREVVRVAYSRAHTSAEALANAAAAKGYRPRPNGDFRVDAQPKYYLTTSPYAGVWMTELQASRVNALLGQGKRPDALLSPRQLASL